MSSFTFTHLFSLPRWHSTCVNYPSLKCVRVENARLQKKWIPAAMSGKEIAKNVAAGGGNSEDNVAVEKKTAKTRTSRRPSPRTRKKPSPDVPDPSSEPVESSDVVNEESEVSTSSEGSRKTSRRGTRKTASVTATVGEESAEKKVRRKRKTKKTDEDVEDQGGDSDTSYNEQSTVLANVEEEKLGLDNDGVEDLKYAYGLPPLVCCFGAAQDSFVPSGRPAYRFLDYEIRDKTRHLYWEPEKFTRAPGGCAGAVALALARLHGKVAFMGKLADDNHGQAILYNLNMRNVQTRSVCIEKRRATALSQMKIAKRGRLKMTCTKPCAEDSLLKSEIKIDVLKEAKVFYFSTHSLLDKYMRLVTLQAIKIAKQLGALIFYDVNLPLPLWQSSQETKQFIEEVWGLADIIEVTKQELEFLCGIEPVEEFDTRDNNWVKFAHYKREVTQPLWHDNLMILFVTNGTSVLHYYTKEHDGAVHGMEDPNLTPFTCDMSASGDGIVAGLLKKLSLRLENFTDKSFLEDSMRYAMHCGVTEQWVRAYSLGFPPNENIDVEPDPNGTWSFEEELRKLESVER